jgi:hypothetical protein
MRVQLFIRNDDVWTLDKSFRFFFNAALKRRLPVVHAVIPGKMDQGLIRFLCKAKEKNSELVDIVQHGWMHTNHSESVGKKYEFGATRSLKLQHEDIKKGVKQMRLAFGDLFTPVFVPPFHGYDQKTLAVIRKEKFWALSAGNNIQDKKMPLVNFPATISFSQYDTNGTISIHGAGQMLKMLLKSATSRALSGIVMHHSDFKEASSQKELIGFLDYLDTLQSKKGWRMVLFSDVQSEGLRLTERNG